MSVLFQAINNFFDFIVPIADFLWEFPTNFKWYQNIPVLGNFAFAVILLLGTGIYLTFKTGFIQVMAFKKGIKILATKKETDTGVSSLASFLLSSAMRVGPGNIMGVTGAISVGGPGALFWMWVSAFFGMSTAFVESVLAQLFKEKNGKEFVGGLPFYGQKILGNKRWVGIILSSLFIIYALFVIPSQAFHLFTSFGSIADTIAGKTFGRQSTVYYGIAIVLIITVLLTVIGGIKRVTAVTDVLVPIMAVIYTLIVILIILVNLDKVPYFFKEVIGGAFKPNALFGGAFGVALAQGIKRGLMSNEAGQGTITMAAATAENKHPAEQGFVQCLGVFLDTMVICSMTGFVIVMAHVWTGTAGVAWESIEASKLTVYLSSIKYLVPGTALDGTVTIIVSLCYGMFAFTTLLGLILFAEVSANLISRNKKFIMGIRLVGALFFVPFGALTVLAGLELTNLWYIGDFVNIVLVYVNVPIILIGSNYALKILKNYKKTDGTKFKSKSIGVDTDVWK
ncbi:alanine:cation symporter family protein [Clostridium sp. CF011]|uniref:alanine/glycine:cation symporter family protein n=1 Tax=Clostridium sp. CF011 TaxID=2843318 RepID=UPI001C0E01F1|nr:amino acid carrier protein [Clostridium sp. CF011]MBU3091419.1 alanine:cation symporter family protein [Clostridium sp. CF011]WAG69232.1 alanine:cation symporter family protein [Clostridium sp. CF011]